MSHSYLKTLIELGNVLLPEKPTPETDTDPTRSPLQKHNMDDSVSLLDFSPHNSVVTSLYPVLLPNALSRPESNIEQSHKPVLDTTDFTKNQTCDTSFNAEDHKASPQSIMKVGSSRSSRQHNKQQLTTNPLKSLSPIHEEQSDEESVKSAPLFTISDDHFEPLTASFSNQSTYSNDSAHYFDHQCYSANPLSVPYLHNAQVLQPSPISSQLHKPSKPEEVAYSYIMAPTQPSNLSPTRMSHRHPSYRRLASSGEDVRPGHAIESLVSQPIHFSYNRPHTLTNCSLRTCNKSTTSAEILTCICPRCGPFSVIRYCSIAHLHADLRRHYIEDCTRRTNMLALVAIGTMEPFNRQARIFATVTNGDDDSLERHRQAVYRSYPTNVQIDYSIFGDADLLLAGESEDFIPSAASLSRYRGRGKVVATVAMREKSVVKAQFAGTLEKLLRMGVSAGRIAPDKCRLLFSWIKVYFDADGRWDEIMMNRVALAMQLEFGYKVPLKLFESEDQYGG